MKRLLTPIMLALAFLTCSCEVPMPSELKPFAGAWTYKAPNGQVWQYDIHSDYVKFRIDLQKQNLKINKIQPSGQICVISVNDPGVRDIRIHKVSESTAFISSGLHKPQEFTRE